MGKQDDGRSYITIDKDQLQTLINDKAKGKLNVGDVKERVNFGQNIGKWVNPNTMKEQDTSLGKVISGNTGVHVYPINPNQY